jgi:AcrR family transcriptional regulator
MTADHDLERGHRRARLAPEDRREHLIRVAVSVFAEEGVAGTSVLRITQAAGVSNGTFYRYFRNKQELEQAVGALVVADMTSELARVQETLGMPERIAVGAVWVMRRVAADVEVGAILAELFERRSDLIGETALQLDADIRAGVSTGVFVVEHRPLLVRMWSVLFGVAARDVLSGADPADVGSFVAQAQLRVLGVGVDRAREAADVAVRLVAASTLEQRV